MSDKIVRKLCGNDLCEGCSLRVADTIVYSRKLKKVMLCCSLCMETVVDEDYPEYTDQCENCGNYQGVN